jgi:lysozyme family protein
MLIDTLEPIGKFLVQFGLAKEPSQGQPKEEPKSVPSVPPLTNKGDTRNPDLAHLWATCKINPEDEKYVSADCKKLLANKPRYDKVSAVTRVPWYVIAVIHELESGADFDAHLHNGDPLTARTFQVPKGRPVAGNPPFTWEESAIDALGYDGADKVKYWTMGATLDFLECYNGLGYRNKGIYSPYLWSCTNHYTKGKYVADGVWNAEAVSQQVGCAALMKGLGI